MVKKRGLVITFAFVFVLAAVNVFMFISNGSASYTSISGHFVEDIPKSLFSSNLSLIIFIAEWIVLVLIIIAVYSRFLKRKKDSLTQQDYQIIKQKKTKSETDLDVLYELLQNKKILNIRTISKVFKISGENALKWAKILENHGLATIDYPTFRTPEVKINEKEKEENPEKGKQEEGKPEKGEESRQKEKVGEEKRKPEKRKAEKGRHDKKTRTAKGRHKKKAGKKSRSKKR